MVTWQFFEKPKPSVGKTCTHRHLGGLPAKTSPSSAGGVSSIPGMEAKIPHASWPKKPKHNTEQYCNKSYKSFKNGAHQKKKKKAAGATKLLLTGKKQF